MKLNNFIQGLQTLQPYYKDQNGFHIGAEHDIFYAYATDTELSKEIVVKMCELGWFQPEAPTDEEGEFGPENYTPDEGWAAFT